MDGVFSRARPTKLHVYVDETVRDLPDRRRLLGAGALIVVERRANPRRTRRETGAASQVVVRRVVSMLA